MTGTAVATREPKAQLVAGGDVAAIVPRTLEETFRLASALAGSGMAPASLKTPEQVMVAIMAGAELGLPPFQSLQSFAVINGKPAIWGDGLMAVVRSHGFKVREWADGEGDATVARCEVTRPDTGEVIPGEFSVADAKKANLWGKAGPWQQYPKRMLKMRARAFALRDGAADVLRGFQIREEVEDYETNTGRAGPQATGMRARLEARAVGTEDQQGFDAGHVDAETAPPAEAEFTDPAPDAPHEHEAAEPLGDTAPASSTASGPTELPAGMMRGSDLLKDTPPAEDVADPLEWKVEAERYVELAFAPDDLTALNAQWDREGRWDRLKAASKADWQDLVDKMRARNGELLKDEARGQ